MRMWSGLGEGRRLFRLDVRDFAISHDHEHAVLLLLVFDELFISLFQAGKQLVPEFQLFFNRFHISCTSRFGIV